MHVGTHQVVQKSKKTPDDTYVKSRLFVSLHVVLQLLISNSNLRLCETSVKLLCETFGPWVEKR